MDGENTAGEEMRRPGAIVGQCGIQTVSAVDENHPKPALPAGADDLTAGNNRNDGIFEASRRNIATKFAKAVELACRIDQGLIVVTFAGLMLLSATMMIKGEYGGAMFLGSLPQPNGGFPTIAANLKERSDRCSLVRPLV